MAEYKVKFAHGKKANAATAVSQGKIDEDDFIVFSDTDDELAFVTHNKEIKPIKARTNEDIILTSKAIGELAENYTIPAGSSIDDVLNQFKGWLTTHGDAIIEDIKSARNGSSSTGVTEERVVELIAQVVNNAPVNLDTLKEISDGILAHQDSVEAMEERLATVETAVEQIPDIKTNADKIPEIEEKLDALEGSVAITDYDELLAEEETE